MQAVWREQERLGLALPPDPTAPARARSAVCQALTGWRLASLAEPVLLAVSELVTNAIRHGRPPVRLTVRRTDECLSIGVADEGETMPVRREGDEAAEGGRGLALVETLATKTGSRVEPPGKVVWAEFDLARAGAGGWTEQKP